MQSCTVRYIRNVLAQLALDEQSSVLMKSDRQLHIRAVGKLGIEKSNALGHFTLQNHEWYEVATLD